jgi:hypothetical protein
MSEHRPMLYRAEISCAITTVTVCVQTAARAVGCRLGDTLDDIITGKCDEGKVVEVEPVPEPPRTA